jgi:hypothetical protein
LGLTEHDSTENQSQIILINYSSQPLRDHLTINEGWLLSDTLGSEFPRSADNLYEIVLPPNGVAVWKLESVSIPASLTLIQAG